MLADLHMHSKYSSCSVNEPKVILERTKHLDSIAITDHNSFKGYEAVKKLNKNKDFNIIPGCEFKSKEGDVVGYYVNEMIPKNTPLIEVVEKIKEQGGLVSIPHPFDLLRTSAVKNDIFKVLKKVDLIEGLNGRCFFLFNNKAQNFALKQGLPAIASTDAHYPFELGRVYTEFKDEDILKPVKFFDNRVPFQFFYFEVKSKIHKELGKRGF